MLDIAKSEKGTVLIELVISCLVLIIFFYVCAGTWFLIRDKVYLHKVARNGAREAVIIGGDVEAGRNKAYNAAQQFFGSQALKVDISIDRYDSYKFHSVTCSVSYRHPVFGNLGREVDLHDRATFGWQDEAKTYE